MPCLDINIIFNSFLLDVTQHLLMYCHLWCVNTWLFKLSHQTWLVVLASPLTASVRTEPPNKKSGLPWPCSMSYFENVCTTLTCHNFLCHVPTLYTEVLMEKCVLGCRCALLKWLSVIPLEHPSWPGLVGVKKMAVLQGLCWTAPFRWVAWIPAWLAWSCLYFSHDMSISERSLY